MQKSCSDTDVESCAPNVNFLPIFENPSAILLNVIAKIAHLPPYARAINGVGRVPDGTLLEVAFFEPLRPKRVLLKLANLT